MGNGQFFRLAGHESFLGWVLDSLVLPRYKKGE